MRTKKLLTSILLGICVCFMSATSLTACSGLDFLESLLGSYGSESLATESSEEGTSDESLGGENSEESGFVEDSEAEESASDSESVPPHEHDFSKEVIEDTYLKTAATCDSKAVYYYVCECGEQGETTFEYGTVLAHDLEQHKEKLPTCGEIGWNAYETCKRAGCDYTTYVELPMTEVHTWDAGKITKGPTCTEEGVMTYTCTVCKKATKTESVKALDHDWKRGTPVVEEGAYICTKGYMTVDSCNICHTVEAHVVQPIGCNVVAWDLENAVAPTFEKEGTLTGICEYCGQETKALLPKLDKTAYVYTASEDKGPCTDRTGFDVYAIWVNAKGETSTAEANDFTKYEVKVSLENIAHTVMKANEIVSMDLDFYYVEDWSGIITEIHGQYSTCSKEGKGVYKCVECGEAVAVPTYRKHALGELVVDKAATCTEAGYGHKDCADCDYVEKEISIAMLSHNYQYALEKSGDALLLNKTCGNNCGTEWDSTPIVEYTETGVDATCVAKGYKTYTCMVTNETTGEMENLTLTEELDMTAHTVKGELLPAPNKAQDGTEFYYLDDWTGYIIEIHGAYAACNNYGRGVYVCEHKECGAMVAVVTLRRHTYSNSEVTTPPTCETEGVLTFSCSKCGANDQQEGIPALDHTPEYTFVKEDKVFYYVTSCSVATCKKELDRKDVTADVTVDASNATCKNTAPFMLYNYVVGEKTYTISESIDFAPHMLNSNPMTESEYVLGEVSGIDAILGKEPNCQREGDGVYVCDVCQKMILVVLSKTGHNFVETERQDAACEVDGWIVRECSVCDAKEEETIPALVHKYEVEILVKPTLTEKGSAQVYCANCDRAKLLELPTLNNKAYVKVVRENTCESIVTDYSLDLNKYYSQDLEWGNEGVPALRAEFTIGTENSHDVSKVTYTWFVTIKGQEYKYTAYYCKNCDKMIVTNVEEVETSAPETNE